MEADVAERGLQLQQVETTFSSCCDAGAGCPAYGGDGKANKTACKRPQAKLGRLPISRWVVFLLYCAYCLLAGPAFLNWTTIADMLYKGDAFLWECEPGTIPNPPPEPHEAKCPAQEIAVNNLFTVGTSSYFVFAMLGGIMLDYAGPKLGALSGLACLVLGWLLLAFSSEAFRAYVPAMVFVGAGIDMAFFPCLCGANLFPGFVATIIALYGACRSISFVVGLALRGVFFNVPGATLRATLLGYVTVGLGFCLCVAFLIIPWTAWPPAETEEEGSAGEKIPEGKRQAQPLKATNGNKRGSEGSVGRSGSSPLHHDRVTTTGSCKDAVLVQESAETELQLAQRPGEAASADALLMMQRQEDGRAGLMASQEQGRCAEKKENADRASMFKQLGVSVMSFARDLVSPAFLPLIPYFIFVLIDILFFTPSAKRLIPDAYAANQVITVCGFAPCIVLGYLADRIGIVRVMMLCNSAGLLAWVLLLIPEIPCFTVSQYIVSILFTCQMSFLVSQIYCYVTELFPPENLGKLIGFLCSTGGVISLVTSPMRDYSVNNSFYPMTILCLALAAINEGLLVFMFYWQRRTKRCKQEGLALEERVNEDKVEV